MIARSVFLTAMTAAFAWAQTHEAGVMAYQAQGTFNERVPFMGPAMGPGCPVHENGSCRIGRGGEGCSVFGGNGHRIHPDTGGRERHPAEADRKHVPRQRGADAAGAGAGANRSAAHASQSRAARVHQRSGCGGKLCPRFEPENGAEAAFAEVGGRGGFRAGDAAGRPRMRSISSRGPGRGRSRR